MLEDEYLDRGEERAKGRPLLRVLGTPTSKGTSDRLLKADYVRIQFTDEARRVFVPWVEITDVPRQHTQRRPLLGRVGCDTRSEGDDQGAGDSKVPFHGAKRFPSLFRGGGPLSRLRTRKLPPV